jgi:hypothetical protein
MRIVPSFFAAASGLALAACVWQPYPTPPARQSSRPDPVTMTARPASEQGSRPTQIGYLFYFRQPVPDGWNIVETPHEDGPEATTSPLCVLTRGDGAKIVLLLKSYVPADLTVDGYREAILADPNAWLARMPTAFRDPPPAGTEKGFIAVGTFPGLDGRWLVGAGRWPVGDHEAMTGKMKDLFVSMAVTGTDARLDGIVVEPKKQICASYF